MTYRIDALSSEQEAEAMVAADSFDAIVERLQRMVTAGRSMILAVREFTYTGRPPMLYGAMRLDTEAYGSGIQTLRRDRNAYWTAALTNGDYFDGRRQFGFGVDIYEYSGNESEALAWRRYESSPDGGPDRHARRQNMTHVAFSGGLPSRKYQNSDRIVITEYNGDGVATERTLGFEPADGSW